MGKGKGEEGRRGGGEEGELYSTGSANLSTKLLYWK